MNITERPFLKPDNLQNLDKARKLKKMGFVLMPITGAAAIAEALLNQPILSVVALAALAVQAKSTITNIHSENSLRIPKK